MLFARLDSCGYQIMRKHHNCGDKHFWTCREGPQSRTVWFYGSVKNDTESGLCSSASLLGDLHCSFFHGVRRQCSQKAKSHYTGAEKVCDTLDKLRIKKKLKAIKNIWHGCPIQRNTENNPFIAAVVLRGKALDLLYREQLCYNIR